MVRDGIYYGGGMLVVAALVAWLAAWPYAIPPIVFAAFFLWFFRDPQRANPADPLAIVSPADGKVTDVSRIMTPAGARTRISIFLNVFDVHVNRSPIRGVIRAVEYRRGSFRNAMGASSSEQNEQNIVTVEGEGRTVIFKQIAGLLARRIVFTRKVGEQVERGERVGMIKFGSRVDVMLEGDPAINVKIGDRVKGGSSIVGRFAAMSQPMAPITEQQPAGVQ